MQEVLITASKEELLIVSSPWNLNRKQGILLEYKTTRANHQAVVLIFFSLDVRSRIPCFCLLPPWILLLLVCKIAVWISTCQLVSMFFSNANYNHLRWSPESKTGPSVSKSDWKRHRCQLLKGMANPKKMLVDIESSMLWRVMKIENLICLVCVLQSCATWVWEGDQTRTIVTRMDIGGYRLHIPFQSTEGWVFQWRIVVKNRMNWCTHLVWRTINQIWVKTLNQKTIWTADAWFTQHFWFYFEENRSLLCSRH